MPRILGAAVADKCSHRCRASSIRHDDDTSAARNSVRADYCESTPRRPPNHRTSRAAPESTGWTLLHKTLRRGGRATRTDQPCQPRESNTIYWRELTAHPCYALRKGAELKVGITFKLLASIRFDDESGVYVSSCPALGVASQGCTEAEAKDALRSAVVMFIETCYRRKTLDNILNDRGFDPAGDEAADDLVERIEVAPLDVRQRENIWAFEVPFNLATGRTVRSTGPGSRGGVACPS